MKKTIWTLAEISIIVLAVAAYVLAPQLIDVATSQEDDITKDAEDIREATAGTVTEKEMTAFASEGKTPLDRLKI